MDQNYRKSIFLLLLLMAFSATAQQQLTVSGKVVDIDNQPLVGANIVVKGTTHGTVTDIEGNYRLELDEDEKILVFSYIGFETTEEQVGSRSVIDVTLYPDLQMLMEITVVGAFNIEQEKRSINYAVQEIEAKNIEAPQQLNIVNSLQGQVAGAMITGNGAPGAPSQILLRGASSVGEGRNNQPLFVVDGIPIDNSAVEQGGNRGMDLNPADIESITVLKGPSAAALYGLQAANGALIITTKSGKSGKTSINVGSSLSFDRPTRYMPQQKMYQRGLNGLPDNNTTQSWGPTYRRDQPIYDNQEEFFETGVTQNYNFNVSGGNDKTTMYFSYNLLDQSGIVPMTDYTKHSGLLKGSHKLRDNLSLGVSVNYITSENTRAFSNNSGGFMNRVMRWPLSDDMSNYLNPNGTRRFLLPIENFPAQTDNPYWFLENNPTVDDVNRWINQFNISYNPLKWLTLTYRLGLDRSNFHLKRQRAISTGGNGLGSVYELERDNEILSSDFLVSVDKKIGSRFNLSGTVGSSIREDRTRSLAVTGEGLLNEGLYSLNNTERQVVNSSNRRRNIAGVFGDVKLDYYGIAYLNVTGRNDWSSTLPEKNNSFFYPSISAGLVFSELIPTELNVFSFGKIRASWAQVGFDASPHSLTPVLTPNQTEGGGFKNLHTAGNPNLKPEMTTSKELGVELHFFNSRIRLDATYYDMLTEDQIIRARVSPGTGFVIQTFNAGSVSNKGYEIMLNANAIKRNNFDWNITLNASHNDAVLETLPSHMAEYRQTYGQTAAGNATSVPGRAFFAVSGVDYVYNDDGRRIIGENGLPTKTGSKENYLGDREPDMIVGLTNSFRYKNFNLSFLWDFRVGGKVLNATGQSMMGVGMHEMLEEYRNIKYVFDGVVNTGSEESPVWEENTQEVVLDQAYFQIEHSSIGTNFLEDADWARLRFVTLSYDLPSEWLDRIGISNLQLTATGRNLLLFTPYSGIDPEVSSAGNRGGSGNMGIDFGAIPQMKGLTFGIKASF
ncbi:SusC/RagA family TonB-linked outer membrane protein [Fulvivirga sp. M361]|uniref:SusC/RagA family TonB-linked outer membrane protein n=1 Tax=Fulvivirga sp. M361 TaxID=2594266 RepID=UPI001179BD56|nr:SusC/RagA family TonB-linked outer membrane protein [Fulvivirga sp. M361]TRX48614.1 SusC/RagA family TonB-linked outer membrane protein [Fulvivirga sp. M361]